MENYNRTYYLEINRFREDLENYVKENKRIAAGYDGVIGLYYITIL